MHTHRARAVGEELQALLLQHTHTHTHTHTRTRTHKHTRTRTRTHTCTVEVRLKGSSAADPMDPQLQELVKRCGATEGAAECGGPSATAAAGAAKALPPTRPHTLLP